MLGFSGIFELYLYKHEGWVIFPVSFLKSTVWHYRPCFTHTSLTVHEANLHKHVYKWKHFLASNGDFPLTEIDLKDIRSSQEAASARRLLVLIIAVLKY